MEKLKKKMLDALNKRKLSADVYMVESVKTEVQANDGQIEKVTAADSFGACVRVFKGGRTGSGYFTAKDAGEAEKMMDAAAASAVTEGYAGYSLPGPAKPQNILMSDPELAKLSLDDKKNAALTLERAARSDPKVKFVRDTIFSSGRFTIRLFNTAGLDCVYEKTNYFAYTSAVAVDGASQEVVENSEAAARYSELNLTGIGEDCSNRAAGLLHGEPLLSGKYTVILPPYVACDFMALLSGLFLADNIRKGKSLLAKNKEGDMIASPELTIMDDALMDWRAGSFPVDDEGTPAQNKAVVQNGKLRTFLYDIINAEHFKQGRTGNCVRQGYKMPPECGVTNFYVRAGTDSMDRESGIFVNSMMGLHMTDTVSGNFSLGINGWLVERGERKQAVRETLITGNIRDMLKNISRVCGDLKYYGNFGSPTLVVRDIMAAGK
jgi:PmbA protein